MFGDIISDLCAQLVGGLGFASSGNIGDDYGVFEPTHGSAPKYAGQHKVNPMAMILTLAMMMKWLGYQKGDDELIKMGGCVEGGVAQVVVEQKVCTYDMGGSNTTLEVGEAVGNAAALLAAA